MNAPPVIVCPLAFERDALAKHGVRGRLMCIGPGEAGVERLAGLVNDDEAGPIILAGVAGALDESLDAGEAFVISEVIGQDDSRWTPSWRGDDRDPLASVSASRDVLTTPRMKRAFAARTGAQLVDQESERFARLATERGWNWGIVRGVSDDLSTSLPPDVHAWVTNDGRTRLSQVMLSCLKRPKQIASLLAMQRTSARALNEVAAILKTNC